jgi:hypothetical protein
LHAGITEHFQGFEQVFHVMAPVAEPIHRLPLDACPQLANFLLDVHTDYPAISGICESTELYHANKRIETVFFFALQVSRTTYRLSSPQNTQAANAATQTRWGERALTAT